MADHYVEKAKVLHYEAESKLEKLEKSRFKILNRSQSDKYEALADRFTKAAKSFQLGKLYTNAGNAFIQAAKCYAKSALGSYNAANSYISAAHCFQKEDLTAAAAIMLKGIEILTEDGKFSAAAKCEKEIAEMFEQLSDFDNAIKHYELAFDFYESEGSIQTGCASLLKVAHLAADKGDYHKAIEIFEKVSDLGSTGLTRHIVKEYFLKAGILYLCLGDVVAAGRAAERWAEKVPEFCGTREHNFLLQLIAAVKDVDVEGFKAATGEWDQISPLDKWKQNLLLKIMDSIKEENEEDLT